MDGININITNTLTFIKIIFKNIYLNKRYVNFSSFRDLLNTDLNNINKQTTNSFVNNQTKIILAKFNLNVVNIIIYVKMTLKHIIPNKKG